MKTEIFVFKKSLRNQKVFKRVNEALLVLLTREQEAKRAGVNFIKSNFTVH